MTVGEGAAVVGVSGKFNRMVSHVCGLESQIFVTTTLEYFTAACAVSCCNGGITYLIFATEHAKTFVLLTSL